MSALRIFGRLARSLPLRPVVGIPLRLKYTQHQGVKGIRNRKSFFEAQMQASGQDNEDLEQEEQTTSSDLADMRFLDDRWVLNIKKTIEYGGLND